MMFRDIKREVIRSNQCYFCRSTNCFTRIYTVDLTFDEIACHDCKDKLVLHADRVLGNPGKMRHHLSSLANVKRYKFD